MTAECLFDQALEQLLKSDFGPFFAVPCSTLNPILSSLAKNRQDGFYWVNNEGEAVAMAAGAYLAGRKPVVLMQNSGLGNAVNPLTSLIHTYKIPLLLIIGWRGSPYVDDAPQHELMGKVTLELLDSLKISAFDLMKAKDEIKTLGVKAAQHLNGGESVAWLVPHSLSGSNSESFYERPYQGRVINRKKNRIGGAIPVEKNLISKNTRFEFLEKLMGWDEWEECFCVSTTGYSNRELYNAQDRDKNFYMVGSMGCAPSLALGISLAMPDKKMLVIDGDGALLMRLESLVSVGYYQPKNFIHLVFNNQVHASTGGQPTLASSVNLLEVASGCGYQSIFQIYQLDELEACLDSIALERGPAFVEVKTLVGGNDMHRRPQIGMTELAERFQKSLLFNVNHVST